MKDGDPMYVKEISSDRDKTFTMHGSREALELCQGAFNIDFKIDEIEKAAINNPSYCFDLSKALIESTCKTILKDRGHELNKNIKIETLVKETLNALEEEAQFKKNLNKTINGLNAVVKGLSELRNDEGIVSHGKDGYAKSPDPIQAQLAARAADAIVNFLIKTHKKYPTNNPNKREHYDDYPEFNEYIDELTETVRIFNYEYQPSEVLFHVDQKAYFALHLDFLSPAEDELEDDEN